MSDALQVGVGDFLTSSTTKTPTYTVSEFAPRGTVKRNGKGEPTITCVIGEHAKGKYPALVQEAGDVQVGLKLEVIGAAIRDGVISPEIVKQLQEAGQVYDPELHAPESEEDESADEQE